jgi:hypothetical protein
VPENIDTKVGDKIAGTRFLCIEKRHCIAGTSTTLQPQEIGHIERSLAAAFLTPGKTMKIIKR